MKRFSCLLITAACFGMFNGCASYRNTSRDHDIPVFRSPPLTIDGLKSPQTRTNQNPDIAIALAISGGGHRAANLATGIMLGLEKLKIPQSDRTMLEEVDYFSTVSGGGFAAGTYISSLYDHINNNAFFLKQDNRSSSRTLTTFSPSSPYPPPRIDWGIGARPRNASRPVVRSGRENGKDTQGRTILTLNCVSPVVTCAFVLLNDDGGMAIKGVMDDTGTTECGVYIRG